MDGYSDDSDGDYTETKVLLGYADEEAVGGDTISHLGGEPIWPHPSSPADARLAKCACCNKLMPLLLQLDGAIPESPHARIFYVFACRGKTCRRKRGSVKALRAVKVAEARIREEEAREEERRRRKKEVVVVAKTGDVLFGSGNALGGPAVGTNPFSTATSPFSTATNPFSTATNPFSTATTAAKPTPPTLEKTFAEALRISASPAPKPEPLLYGPSEPWPSPLPYTYPLFYLDAELETLTPEKPPTQATTITTSISDDDTLPVSNSDADDGHLDTVFQRFADRAGQNPEQVLRYERGGEPLLYSADDEVAKTLLDTKGKFSGRRVPACQACGKRERVFEFQLMPHAITVLEGDEIGLDGMEWGTVVVATCVCVPKIRDANGVGWVEEWVGVQWEGRR